MKKLILASLLAASFSAHATIYNCFTAALTIADDSIQVLGRGSMDTAQGQGLGQELADVIFGCRSSGDTVSCTIYDRASAIPYAPGAAVKDGTQLLQVFSPIARTGKIFIVNCEKGAKARPQQEVLKALRVHLAPNHSVHSKGF